MQRATNPLSKVLEEARALQLRQGITAREALALALANERRALRMDTTDPSDTQQRLINMPAAACLDARLPRDREPSVEEIREAWKECVEQSWAFSGGP